MGDLVCVPAAGAQGSCRCVDKIGGSAWAGAAEIAEAIGKQLLSG